MLRRLYCLLLRLHPPYFRQRFANEMLLIFDEKTTADGRRAAARLMADGAASLARQWALRPRFWEQPARPVADGGPHFLSFERYKLHKGALLYGALLSVAIFAVLGITFNYGIHERLRSARASISNEDPKTASVQCSKASFGTARSTAGPRAANSQVTLGPRSKEPQGIWARLLYIFGKPSPSQQLQEDRSAQSQREAPAQGIISANAQGGAAPSDTPTIRNLKIQLPHPSGKYGVARVAYDWVDGNRREPTAKYPDARREVMVYLWYPVERDAGLTAAAADYLPHAELIARNLSRAELQQGWGYSWPRVFSGSVLTDTHKRSPIAGDGERFPLLIFSPGLGLSSTSYTSQIQEVVSRGYIVASIEPDESAVAFPDGRVIHPASDPAFGHGPAAEASSEVPAGAWSEYLDRIHTAGMPRVESRAADIRFTMDQLAKLDKNEDQTFPFAGRIDFHNIGVWGHSLGGRAAARACRLDDRIKACLNADGVGPDGPVFPYESAGLPRQPFMWMETSQLPPAINSILTSYKITRKDQDKGRQLELIAKEQELQACPNGSYHLMINGAATNHYSFTDWPLLEAEGQGDFDKASHALEPIEAYSIAFFDKYLKHHDAALLDEPRNTASAQITLKKYGKAR
ncbi:MAG: hypothetical protein DMG67_10945 [Acidobacteria bacterium]|nr:MAG: hypothetical protein DMG67_10945 [Acidobacteriota bacterium]